MAVTLVNLINIFIIFVQLIFRKDNVKSYGFDKIDMNEDLIKDKLYEIKDQFNKRKMIPAKFYLYI